MTEPQIYVANLAAYNNGEIIGNWINANQNADKLSNQVQEILNQYPDNEEYIILDYEGFGDIELYEYESIESVARIASAISEICN